MRYARARCKFVDKGEIVTIQGRYHDDPSRERTVSVFKEDLEAYNKGEGPKRYIQNAFPYLSADDREFLISGMSPEGFDRLFPPDDE